MLTLNQTAPGRVRPARDFPTVPVTPQKAEKPAISVVGLGYVGAVSCACLSSLGHRVVGVDIDETKMRTIGAGEAPIHERDLGPLLKDAVSKRLLTTTGDLVHAVRLTDVTFVSVGTPTAADGGSDTRFIEIAAAKIGEALRDKGTFHVVIMRCSVPPGTTQRLMVPVIERVSGKVAGVDFGVAFNPEFLREGVAVEDFRNPAKTVIGASDPKTAEIVKEIFKAVDANPILTSIETAEMVKYVDNVWHATKVCFGNEVGRLSKALDVDGHDVMDIFVQDTKLNLSPYYLKPGFAYGGSCLPKEVRAMQHLAETHNVSVPLIDGLQRSNVAQIDRAVTMALDTGAKRIAVLGLAFKPGTDDLRESPILEVMARLCDHGVELVAHDYAIGPKTDISGQLAYVRHGSAGLGRLASDLSDMLCPTVEEALDVADAVIVTHACPAYRVVLSDRPELPVVDVVRVFSRKDTRKAYSGIGW